MTRFADGIESGSQAPVSAQASRAGVNLTRTHRFPGGGNQTWTGFFPSNTSGVNASVYIIANGSTATSDTLTITASAGSTPLITFAAMGSATGLLSGTTVGLGTKTVVASACWELNRVGLDEIEVPFRVILSSVDTATDYGLELFFRRKLGTL